MKKSILAFAGASALISMSANAAPQFVNPMVMLSDPDSSSYGDFSVSFDGVELLPAKDTTVIAAGSYFEIDVGKASFKVRKTVDVDGNEDQTSNCIFSVNGVQYPMTQAEGDTIYDYSTKVQTPKLADDSKFKVYVPIKTPVYASYDAESGEPVYSLVPMSFSCSNILNPRKVAELASSLILKSSGDATLASTEVSVPAVNGPTIGADFALASAQNRVPSSTAGDLIVAMLPFPVEATTNHTVKITIPSTWSIPNSTAVKCGANHNDVAPTQRAAATVSGKTISFKPVAAIPASSSVTFITCSGIVTPALPATAATGTISISNDTEVLVDGEISFPQLYAASTSEPSSVALKHTFSISRSPLLASSKLARVTDAYTNIITSIAKTLGFSTPIRVTLLSQSDSTREASTILKTTLSYAISVPKNSFIEIFNRILISTNEKRIVDAAIAPLGNRDGYSAIESSKGPFTLLDHCFDNEKNENETDVDCGGACGACGVNKQCIDGTDCGSSQCVNSVCQDVASSTQVMSIAVAMTITLFSIMLSLF